MRRYIKNQLQNIINSLYSLQGELLGKKTEDIIDSLQDCQQAAIAVGETLESLISNKNETETIYSENTARINMAVSLLEKYCEELFFISQEKVVSDEHIDKLNILIMQVKDIIQNIQLTYQVVFFPYKAEMWDSLESIWRVCSKDERCEAVVVPIPYYRYDAKKKETTICYDGDKFPEDVPVISYLNYSLQNEMPDVAYVHNPYDNSNFVTSIHPAFYSSELKKYVRKLVYVPYYVTTGAISPEHLLFPVYVNMDYMVVQSQFFKDGCKEMFYYNRILPFGSPKLDKVIYLCSRGKEKLIPEEWKPYLDGKKSLMLNTSLNCFLQQSEQYLQKLYFLFQWVKEHNKIAIVWRPHPLLEATIHSMRPQLLEKYQNLKNYFVKERIGIFDNTPDIAHTVAIVDGYIGEEGTSVVNLFGATGKPLFILNNFIYKEREKNWNRRIRISDMIYEKGKWYLTSASCNGLFSVEGSKKNADEIKWNEIQFEGRVEGQPYWYNSNPYLLSNKEQIYMSPAMAFQTGIYDVKKAEFSILSSPTEFEEERKFVRCREMASYDDKIFFLPNKSDAVWEYCTTTKCWIKHSRCIEDLHKGLAEETYANAATFSGYVQEAQVLYIVASYTNRILCFHMDNGKYEIYEIGDSKNTYSAITGSNGVFWLAETISGKIIKWDKVSGMTEELIMPQEFERFSRYDGSYYVHNRLFEMDSCIISTPAFSNCMVKVDKETKKVSLCAKEVWNGVGKAYNDYHSQFYFMSGFGKKADKNILWVQRTFDDALIVLNIDTEKYQIYYPTMTSQALKKMLEDQDGFERPNRDYFAFARRESRLFSMEDFMEDLIFGRLEEVREKQLGALSEFAVNLDGSCGEKVHKFMMDVLKDYEDGKGM